MVTVSDSTIRQDVYETIYDIVNSSSIYSSTLTASPTVSAAYVDNDGSFPQVVVYPIDVEYDNFAFGSLSNSNKEIRVLIEVYTKKNKEQDIIADNIVAEILNTTFSGVNLVGIGAGGGSSINTTNTNKIHVRAIPLTFKRG